MIGRPGAARRAASMAIRISSRCRKVSSTKQVDAALGERRGLLGEGRGHLVELGPGRHAGDQAGGADRAGHPRVLARRLARQPGAGQVVGADLVAQPVAVEAEGVGAKGVGLDDLRAGGDVVLVDLPHDVGPGDVELLEVLRDEDARARRAASPSPRRRRGASAWPPGRAYPGAWGSSELCYIHRVSGSTLRPSRRPGRDSEHDHRDSAACSRATSIWTTRGWTARR